MNEYENSWRAALELLRPLGFRDAKFTGATSHERNGRKEVWLEYETELLDQPVVVVDSGMHLEPWWYAFGDKP